MPTTFLQQIKNLKTRNLSSLSQIMGEAMSWIVTIMAIQVGIKFSTVTGAVGVKRRA